MSGYAQWNPSTLYVINDIVNWEGVLFVCIQQPNTGNQPNVSPTWWAGGSGGGVNTVVGSSGITTTGTTAVVVSANLGSGAGGITYTTGTGTQLLTNLPTVGTGSTYAYPSSVTTDAYGRVSAISASSGGVQSITAGTNITLGGTANNPVINSAVDGVQTLTAGANVVITGTTANPIISATSSPLPTPQTPRDLAGASTYTITASEIANAIFYSTVSYSTGTLTVNLPSYADMLALYGGQKTVPFYWGNLNIGSGQVVAINFSTLGDASKIWVNVPIQGNSAPVSLQNYFSAHPTPFSLPPLQIWNGTAYIDNVSGTVSYNFMWAGFANN